MSDNKRGTYEDFEKWWYGTSYPKSYDDGSMRFAMCKRAAYEAWNAARLDEAREIYEYIKKWGRGMVYLDFIESKHPELRDEKGGTE